MSIGPHLLGRNLERDDRSRNFKHPVEKVTEDLRSVTHTLSMPHLDQANLGSCEGNTAAEFLGCSLALKNRIHFNQNWMGSVGVDTRSYRKYLDEKLAVELYAKATTLDDDGIPGTYPPDDTGTSGLGIAKAMRALGGLQRYNWTFTWEAYLATLQHQPIMLGVNWYDSMFEHDDKGFVYDPGTTDKPAGGHAILAYAYRPARWRNGVLLPGYTGCTNHWVNDDGSPWGIKIGRHVGSFWIHDNLLEELLISEQGDSLVPVLM